MWWCPGTSARPASAAPGRNRDSPPIHTGRRSRTRPPPPPGPDRQCRRTGSHGSVQYWFVSHLLILGIRKPASIYEAGLRNDYSTQYKNFELLDIRLASILILLAHSLISLNCVVHDSDSESPTSFNIHPSMAVEASMAIWWARSSSSIIYSLYSLGKPLSDFMIISLR